MIHPLSYCIPDENIVNSEVVQKKHIIISDLIPGQQITYRFGPNDEKEYNEHYQESMFAYSSKKGGWDCLRHYEILSNGCIPIMNFDGCPSNTLTTLPKDLLIECNKILPYKKNMKKTYDEYVYKLLEHMKTHCSTSANTRYFLQKIPHSIKNILLIRCDEGVNYTREFFWIGMKRYIQNIQGVAVEYPKISYLYDSYKGDKKTLHGYGYNYTGKLKEDYNLLDEEIIEKIKNKFWDIVVFGKVGPDELIEGSIPYLPLWSHVVQHYDKDRIVFLYGGDECINLTYKNRYSEHITYHKQFGTCFVRELNM